MCGHNVSAGVGWANRHADADEEFTESVRGGLERLQAGGARLAAGRC